MSNWENRPLTKAQIHYAAMDAHVAVHICDELFRSNIETKKKCEIPKNVAVFTTEHQCIIKDSDEYTFELPLEIEYIEKDIPKELFDEFKGIDISNFKYIKINEECIIYYNL